MSNEPVLPLPDYDQLPLATLGQQIRALSGEQLQCLLGHETHHANRLPVLQLLRQRQRQQQLADGAEPSGGDQSQTGKPADSRHGSPVSPDAAAKPGGPLRHGVAGQTPERDRP